MFKLVDDWKDCWRWNSVRIPVLTILAYVIEAWNALPVAWQSAATPQWQMRLLIAGMVLGVIGRMLKQEKKGKK